MEKTKKGLELAITTTCFGSALESVAPVDAESRGSTPVSQEAASDGSAVVPRPPVRGPTQRLLKCVPILQRHLRIGNSSIQMTCKILMVSSHRSV